MNQRAVLAVAGQNDRPAIRTFQRHRSDIQPQPGLGLGTAVALIAGSLEDWLHLGRKVDSWCARCQMMLTHIVDGVTEKKVVRVHCNTCKSQHTYKPSEPIKAVARAQPGKARSTRYKVLLNGSDAAPKSYSPQDKYQPGDVLKHASFGMGVVTTAGKDGTKIEVLFEGGSKLLVHGR